MPPVRVSSIFDVFLRLSRDPPDFCVAVMFHEPRPARRSACDMCCFRLRLLLRDPPSRQCLLRCIDERNGVKSTNREALLRFVAQPISGLNHGKGCPSRPRRRHQSVRQSADACESSDAHSPVQTRQDLAGDPGFSVPDSARSLNRCNTFLQNCSRPESSSDRGP